MAVPARPEPVPAPKVAARPTQATIVVQLPSEARMWVDGKYADLPSASRSFITPELPLGEEHFYTIRVEVARDGKTLEQSQRVAFKAGQTARVNFGDLSSAAVVSVTDPPASAKVTVKAPTGARVTVDGVECPLTAGTASFDTPKLEPGKKYHYIIKAELTQDGQARSQSQQVRLEAGKDVTVDFVSMTTVAAAGQ